MCDLSLGKVGEKNYVSEFLFQHQPHAIQDLGHFNVNINPFSHKLLKIILTSEGGDGWTAGPFWLFFLFCSSQN